MRPFASPALQYASGLMASSGSFPVLGDVLAGLLSLVIPLAAWIRGVPYITLVRMAANLGIGVLVGSIPLLGDAFDIAWKANRRNYRLLRRHLGEPRRHTWRDWLFLRVSGAHAGVIFAVPVVLAVWLISLARASLTGRPRLSTLRVTIKRGSGRSAVW